MNQTRLGIMDRRRMERQASRPNRAPLTVFFVTVLLFAGTGATCRNMGKGKEGVPVASPAPVPSVAVKASPSPSPSVNRVTVTENTAVDVPVIHDRAFYRAMEREGRRMQQEGERGIKRLDAQDAAMAEREAREKKQREQAAEIARLKRVKQEAQATAAAADKKLEAMQ